MCDAREFSRRHHVFYVLKFWSGVMEWSIGVESNFGVEYFGYLMHILSSKHAKYMKLMF